MIKKEAPALNLASMLVSLDALLDTRLGTIGQFGREKYRGVLLSDYGSRRSDHFDGIDMQEYRRLYKERGAVTLSLSMMTHIVSFIKDFVTRVNITSASAPVQVIPKVDINVYPFNPPEHICNRLCQALLANIGQRAKVSWVRYSPEDLHYDLVKHTYDHMVFYDLGEWLNAQVEDWEKRNRGLSDVTVVFPMLHMAQNIEDVPEEIATLADQINAELSPVINPLQLPIQFFCSAFNATALAMTSEEKTSDVKVSEND